jgi:2-succinyl-5-enolpyruvyl-6-hydroxy-3-cyclohexene-1-carboxylate synthase
VHVNARARKPLEPSAPATDAERALAASVDVLLGRGVTRVSPPGVEPSRAGIAELAAVLQRACRGIIVMGPSALATGPAGSVRLLAEKLGMPLFAESTSQLRFQSEAAAGAVDALDWLLRSPRVRDALRPDCVLRFGGALTSSGLERLLSERGSTELHVVAEQGFPDALSAARSLVYGSAERVAAELLAVIAERPADPAQLAYRERVVSANELAWSAVERALGESSGLSEPLAVRTAVEAVPAGGLLIVGNSLPVREVDAYVRAGAKSLSVACQRGANGIDGLIAGAAGSARGSGKPALLLLGDVSFAHDLGGLAAARLVETPFAIVVLDNEGGRIFEQLPLARLLEAEPEHENLWLTPPALALEHAGPLFGFPYSAPKNLDGLRRAIARAFEQRGVSIIHVRVPPHSARDAAQAITVAIERKFP